MPKLAIHSVLVVAEDQSPLILVHGAANSALVWTFWQDELAHRGWSSHALDLRGHGRSEAVDLIATQMADYADDVVALARELKRSPVLLGWSMGGLVAMMAAASCDAQACIGLAPSAPAQVRDTSVALRAGVFGAEEYGILARDPDDQPTMPDLDRAERIVALESLGPEARLARDERKAGVVIENLRCPLLIITGTADTQWPRARYDGLQVPAEHLSVEGASHWGLVLNRRLLPGIASSAISWLEGVLARPTSERSRSEHQGSHPG